MVRRMKRKRKLIIWMAKRCWRSSWRMEENFCKIPLSVLEWVVEVEGLKEEES